ncbi:MAG: hypothetical protein ACOX4U_07800 [Anaerovoracaceae bacterium]
MFSKRKSFWRGKWYFLLIIGLLGLGYWFNGGFNKEESNMIPDTSAAVRQSTTDYASQNSSRNDDDTNEPYYRVIEEEGFIKIYFCDEKGIEKFVKDTDINFDMLNESDQDLFKGGLIVRNKDELDELLQDFES